MENQEYQNLLANITLLVKKSQTNALIQVNRELSFLYWNIRLTNSFKLVILSTFFYFKI